MEYELYHYGVKGMKWGVRRDRARRARGSYFAKKINDRETKLVNRMNRRRAKMVFSGKDTSKLDSKIKRSKTYISNNQKVMKKALKDLSQKEIDMGRKIVEARPFFGAFVGGVPGSIAGNMANLADYNYVVKKYS